MSADKQGNGAASPRVLTRRFRPQPPKIEARDFRVPPRPYRRIVDEIESLSGSLGRRLAAALANSLQLRIEVTPQPIRFPSFEVVLEGLDERSWAQPLSTPKGDRGLVVFDFQLQEALLGRLLGNKPGVDPDDEEAEATDGEAEESTGAADDAGDGTDEDGEPRKAPRSYRYGFLSRSVMLPTLSVALRELNTQLALGPENAYGSDEAAGKLGLRGFLPGNDACVTLEYQLDNPIISGTLSVVVPLRPLQGLVKRERETAPRQRDPRTRGVLEALVKELDVPLVVQVGRADIEVEEYLRLAVGDVLVLDQCLSQPLDVEVGDKPLFLGRPGRSGGRLAVRIVSGT